MDNIEHNVRRVFAELGAVTLPQFAKAVSDYCGAAVAFLLRNGGIVFEDGVVGFSDIQDIGFCPVCENANEPPLDIVWMDLDVFSAPEDAAAELWQAMDEADEIAVKSNL